MCTITNKTVTFVPSGKYKDQANSPYRIMPPPNDPKSPPTTRRASRNYISIRLTQTDILECAQKTWTEQEQIAETIAIETTKIISEVYEKNPAFFGSKSKKWILGGLFYLLGRRHGQEKTQKQIARILDTNEMTVRASYRNWLKNFPEYWQKPTNNSEL